MSQKNFKKLFTIYFIVFGTLISIFSGIIAYNIQLDSYKKELDTKANDIMIIKKFLILKEEMENLDNIVKSLSKTNMLKEYIKEQDANKLKTLEDVFLTITNINRNIMQLRYIDKNGMEIIRIDQKDRDKNACLTPKDKLQNKSNRDYFIAISSMNEVKSWYSKFDLNMEHGKVELPYNPTLRVGVPIIDEFKNFNGILMVNLSTKNLLESISNSSTFEHYIVDKEANYIVHPDEKYSFSKYTGVSRDIKKDFPKYNPKKPLQENSFDECYVYSLGDVIKNDDDAYLILKPKKKYQEQFLKDRIVSTIYIVFLSILASVFMALYASKKPSELQKTLLKVNRELRRFSKILDKYVVSVRTKKDSTILEASSAFEASSGYSKEELIGQDMKIIRHEDTPSSVISDLWSKILNGEAWDGEIKNRRKDGSEFWLEQHIVAIKDEKGEIESFLSVSQDITLKKELEVLSSTDKLTNVFNRRKLDEFLEHEVEMANRHKHKLSLIIIDIDHFKEVNDNYGHQVGDLVLSQTSKIISDLVRKSDVFGRFGGEEFLLICPHTTEDEAFLLAEKLREEISRHKFDEVGYKTISLGVAQLKEGDNTQTLLKKSDTALYEAKESGRNKSLIYKS